MALNLSTFNIANAIVDPATGKPTVAFLRWINDTVKSIQSAVNDNAQLTADIAFSLQQAGIAVTTANDAKAAALSASRESSLVNSYIDPSTALTTALSTDKATASIIVANHSRVYGDGTRVAVRGATLAGLSLATTYYVTYIDAARTGGAVSYTTTTDSAQAAQGNNRHLVGTVMTPGSDGTGGQSGGTTGPGVPNKFADNSNQQLQ